MIELTENFEAMITCLLAFLLTIKRSKRLWSMNCIDSYNRQQLSLISKSTNNNTNDNNDERMVQNGQFSLSRFVAAKNAGSDSVQFEPSLWVIRHTVVLHIHAWNNLAHFVQSCVQFHVAALYCELKSTFKGPLCNCECKSSGENWNEKKRIPANSESFRLLQLQGRRTRVKGCKILGLPYSEIAIGKVS
jgi:hypothetical protein